MSSLFERLSANRQRKELELEPIRRLREEYPTLSDHDLRRIHKREEERKARDAFLDSIGAVKTPLSIYAIWFGIYALTEGRDIYIDSDNYENGFHSNLIITSRPSTDEQITIPKYYGANSVTFLVCTDFIPVNISRLSGLGHNTFQTLGMVNGKLTADIFAGIPRVSSHPDVEKYLFRNNLDTYEALLAKYEEEVVDWLSYDVN